MKWDKLDQGETVSEGCRILIALVEISNPSRQLASPLKAILIKFYNLLGSNVN
jgi:hypothetical protein